MLNATIENTYINTTPNKITIINWVAPALIAIKIFCNIGFLPKKSNA